MVDARSGAQQRLRILLVGPKPPPMGGIVRYAMDMLSGCLSEQHEMVLFPDNIPFEWRPSSATAEFTWNIFRRDGVLASAKVLGFVTQRAWALDRLVARGNVDIVHVLSSGGYGFFRNAIHIALAKRHGVKTVFHLLGQVDDLYGNASPRLRKVIRFCMEKADVHVVQSPGLAEYVRTFTTRPVYPIFNGVDVHSLTPKAGFAHSGEQRVRVIALGVLGHKKGTFDLLAAAERMAGRLDIEFLFVGAGEVQKFEELAASKGIRDLVRFTGSVHDRTRIEALQTSDIFALPSRAEGQPIALLEAIAAGLPVIVSDVGSNAEVVGAKNGFVIAAGDTNALVRHLETLIGNPALRERMGRFNANDAMTRFQVSRVMKEIDEVYASLFS